MFYSLLLSMSMYFHGLICMTDSMLCRLIYEMAQKTKKVMERAFQGMRLKQENLSLHDFLVLQILIHSKMRCAL